MAAYYDVQTLAPLRKKDLESCLAYHRADKDDKEIILLLLFKGDPQTEKTQP